MSSTDGRQRRGRVVEEDENLDFLANETINIEYMAENLTQINFYCWQIRKKHAKI